MITIKKTFASLLLLFFLTAPTLPCVKNPIKKDPFALINWGLEESEYSSLEGRIAIANPHNPRPGYGSPSLINTLREANIPIQLNDMLIGISMHIIEGNTRTDWTKNTPQTLINEINYKTNTLKKFNDSQNSNDKALHQKVEEYTLQKSNTLKTQTFPAYFPIHLIMSLVHNNNTQPICFKVFNRYLLKFYLATQTVDLNNYAVNLYKKPTIFIPISNENAQKVTAMKNYLQNKTSCPDMDLDDKYLNNERLQGLNTWITTPARQLVDYLNNNGITYINIPENIASYTTIKNRTLEISCTRENVNPHITVSGKLLTLWQ